ncbi:DUF5709 domain-containing protein [Skermania piniformis]
MGSDDGEYEGVQIDEDDQLQPEDSLTDQDLDDVLDRGYSPPDRWRDPVENESLDERLAEEEPDVDPFAEPAQPDESGAEVGARRSGRLVAADEGAESDLIGFDVGIDGAAASAEEAAVHTVETD